MISPFLTTNIFLINLAVMLTTTSITGGIVTFVWLAIGRWLEKMGYVNIVFELMKLSTFFFFCPVGYIFLKAFEMEVGKGYLFSPTEVIAVCIKIFMVVWGIGAICVLLHVIHTTKSLNKIYQDAFPCEKNVQCVYDRVANQLGVVNHYRKTPPLLVQSYRAKVPCVKGIFRPMIILPVKNSSEEELEVIFTHELIHYKQGDVLLKWSMMVLIIVHFYNPFAWVLFHKVHTWSEYACDYKACEKAGGMKHYFNVIVNMALDTQTYSRLSSQLVEGQHELVGRVKRMKKVYGKKHSKWGAAMILSAAFIVSTMSVSAATLETAELYCTWNKETVVKIEDTTQMTEFEVFTEQGDADGIVTVQGEVTESARSTQPINWTVNNNVKMVGAYFDCEVDDAVLVRVNISPSTVYVKVGIENASGVKTYINAKGSVADFYDITESGKYRFFVENTSGQSVTVSGSYMTP